MRHHCAVFEEGEENKNEYMHVFNLYHDSIEKHVQQVPPQTGRNCPDDWPTST